jgi:hypothetical protein
MQQLALRELTRKRGRGREKGEPRPRDLDFMTKGALQDALNELFAIRRIIQQHWNRWKGSEDIAIEIAAERACVSEELLRNFKKKQSAP